MAEDCGDVENDLEEEIARQENVKHLEWIQAIINRLASNSFNIKAWCLTVAAAAYGIAVNRVDWRLSAIGLFVVAAFWFLDSYFLRQERLFRLLYDHVRSDARAVPRFSMHTTRFQPRVSRWAAFFSTTLLSFYGMLVILGVALLFIHCYSLRCWS